MSTFLLIVKANKSEIVFIVDTTSLGETDKQRVLDKGKELALSLLDKRIYSDDNTVKIALSKKDQRTNLGISRDHLRSMINRLTLRNNIGNDLKQTLDDTVSILSKSPSNIKKSIVLFTASNRYYLSPESLRTMQNEGIKLVVVDTSLSEPVVSAPFVPKPKTDFPNIVKVQPEPSDIAVPSLIGMLNVVNDVLIYVF